MKVRGIFGFLVALFVSQTAYSVELVGAASVNITSDTAATAKTIAFDEARRQIIVDALTPYSDAGALRATVANEKTAVLTNLIERSAISGERQSDTVYSASIKMWVSPTAAKNWLDGYGIQNWINVSNGERGTFSVVVMANNKMADWMAVRRVATDAEIDLMPKSFEGNQLTFVAPLSKRGALTIALRENGWRYQDRDGVLYLAK